MRACIFEYMYFYILFPKTPWGATIRLCHLFWIYLIWLQLFWTLDISMSKFLFQVRAHRLFHRLPYGFQSKKVSDDCVVISSQNMLKTASDSFEKFNPSLNPDFYATISPCWTGRRARKCSKYCEDIELENLQLLHVRARFHVSQLYSNVDLILHCI